MKSEKQLHDELRDYYGTAMFNGNPMAMIELEEAERASGEKLRRMAADAGIDVEGSSYEDPFPSMASRPVTCK